MLLRQTENMIMMAKEGSTKILNFITPGQGLPVLGRDHIHHKVKMHWVFTCKIFLPVSQ